MICTTCRIEFEPARSWWAKLWRDLAARALAELAAEVPAGELR